MWIAIFAVVLLAVAVAFAVFKYRSSTKGGSVKKMKLRAVGGPLDKKVIEIPTTGTNAGRHTSNFIVLSESSISREHFKILQENGVYFLQDLGSTTGTFYYPKPQSRTQLSPGIMMKIGSSECKVISVTDTGLELDITSEPTPLRHNVTDFPFMIGRRSSNHLSLPSDPLVSGQHCCIEREGGVFYLRDLKSTNGTGLRLSASKTESKKWPLEHGSVFGCGASKFKVSLGSKKQD